MKGFILVVIIASILMSLIAVPVLAQGIQNVELHGYMQNRFFFNPSSSARFVTERLSLSATGQLGKDGTAYAEVYFHPWLPAVTPAEQFRTYVESAYVDLPLLDGRIRIGKGRQLNFGLTPSYPNRKTTQYGILSETFTQDRIVGAQYAYKSGPLDAGISVYTDQSVSTRGIGDFAGNVSTADVVSHFVDKDVPASNTGELAVSAKLGLKMGSLTAHVSGATGKLNETNLTTLNTPYGLASTDTDHNKYGVDAIYSAGPFVAQGELYQGNFSFLKISGYSVLVGYQSKDSRRAYLRYSALNYDRSPIANQPLTWEPQQLTLGIVQPIRKGVWAEFQYERNTESGGDRDNDLLFVEFFTGF